MILIQVQRVREELGLDEPVVAQYGSWLWSMATGDFGGTIVRQSGSRYRRWWRGSCR